MTSQTSSIVHVEHVFQATAEEVFDAWLDPAMLPHWMFNPDICEESVDRISIDPKPGGEFAFRVTRSGRQIEFRGSYRRIERPRRLVFTWISADNPVETVVDVTIEAFAGGCRLTLVHDLRVKDDKRAAQAKARWEAELGSLGGTIH